MSRHNPWYNPSLSHHTPAGFRDPQPDVRQNGDLQRWRRERKQQGLPRPPQQGYDHFIQQWWQPADLRGNEDSLWWLGHACLLLRNGGRYTLVDPALSSRASPLSFYGPRRKTPPALAIDDLPSLDTVLISHNHYDHLDRRTIKRVLRRFPQVTFVVPLGLKKWFLRLGAQRVLQLDWWQQAHVGGLSIDAVPARH